MNNALERRCDGEKALDIERRLMNEALARLSTANPKRSVRQSGRLIFGLDLTGSREHSLRHARIATAAMLGTRNALYGIQMAPILEVRGVRRFLSAHITIDESTGVALSQKPRGIPAMRVGFWVTGLGVFVFWNAFTLLGALGAKALGNPASWGLDGAVPAVFLGLLWPRLESTFLRVVAATSMVFAILVTPWLPAGLPIIATALVAVVLGWRER